MFVERIRLENFRNYEKLDAALSGGVNVFYGNNGQGKTNVLESVFFCAIGRSFRYGKDTDLVRNGAEKFRIELSVADDITNNVTITYKNPLSGIERGNSGEKSVRVNGIYLTRLGHLMGNLLSVIFSPEDLEIINEGPSVRRKLLDIVISQLMPAHYFDLQQYNKTIAQKNALLRDFDKNRGGFGEMIDVYNEQLADSGSRISYRRYVFSRELEKYAAAINEEISAGEPLAFQYYSNHFTVPADNGVSGDNGLTAEKIKTEFSETLKARKDRETERGHSLYGPQNDDLMITLNGTDLRRFGSQGQKRTAVLAIKLAETRLLHSRTGRKPVLLLDDVFSELDESRCSLLLRSASEYQTLITTANLAELPESVKKSAKIFFVKSGHLELI